MLSSELGTDKVLCAQFILGNVSLQLRASDTKPVTCLQNTMVDTHPYTRKENQTRTVSPT